MKVIDSQNIKEGEKVLIRSSLNVSLDDNGAIIDDLRLRRTLQTIDLVQDKKAIPILISHIKNDQGSTMEPVVDWFKNKGYKTELVKDYIPFNINIMFEVGTLYIFENLRDYAEEKSNDIQFAAILAKYGDKYVNESFDAAHRSHASLVTLPTMLPSYSGVNFTAEVEELTNVFTPKRPFLFIIGGAKLETKAPLVRVLLDKADYVFVGGALMNPILNSRGHNIGKSLMPAEELDVSDISNHQHLVLPTDFIDQNNNKVTLDETDSESILLDIGPESIQKLESLIDNSELVVWNGPLGNYEDGFSAGTDAIAKKLSQSDCYSIIGGGDTLAAVDDQMEAGINWISTGGGAMLDFIESDGDLPAINVLETV